MHCLVCGHKLAIFRRLSSGDFCCPEHRALFLKEQSDRGLACLVEARSETQARNQGAGTRVYAQFLPEELQATHSNARYCSHGPLAPGLLMAPKRPDKAFSKLAPGRALLAVTPEIGMTLPVAYGLAPGLRMKLPPKLLPVWTGVAGTRLRPAGLILPWSSGAPHATFSLSPLVAAAWAQSGNCRPIASHGVMLGELRFTWPAIEGSLELPPQEAGIAAAAYAIEPPAVQSMRVRLDLPSVAPPKPRLAMPLPPVMEEIQAAEPVFAESTAPEAVPVVVASPPAKGRWLSWLFPTSSRPARAPSRARTRHREEEVFDYNEPAPIVTSNSSQAWRAMLAGLRPSAMAVSGVFAILFLFSALAIFFSAPETLTQRSPSWRWGNLRSAIRNRSVLRVEDDFRSGLNRWIGPAGWSQDWSYDQAGFLRPGKLGFLQQSMGLVNYRLELMGQIERKSLGWAFRAKDDHNYYVAKLTIAKPGPLPMVDLIRYSVTEGKESPKIRVPLPFAVRNDTLYQVEMNIRGDQFRASVNGHVVDSWSDQRLQAGGVGFVNGQGEASRVRWIRVSDKDDVIGRVCSFLTARYEPSGGPVLSASYYSLLHFPGNPADF